VKLSAVQDERRDYKQWLTRILPDDMSREDVADELRVTRKTISNMLNPNQSGFGNGLTMLRYLRLAGALKDEPDQSPATSRLGSLEEGLLALEGKVDQASLDVTHALAAIAEAIARIEDRLEGGGGQRRTGDGP
jgi:hypothetical protein